MRKIGNKKSPRVVKRVVRQEVDFPKQIHFLSDDTKAVFVENVSTSSEIVGRYKFTKVHKSLSENKGKEFTMKEEQIKRLLDSKLVKIK